MIMAIMEIRVVILKECASNIKLGAIDSSLLEYISCNLTNGCSSQHPHFQLHTSYGPVQCADSDGDVRMLSGTYVWRVSSPGRDLPE
jgi:hypothetical protein